MPKVSVIIPVYNAEKYLRECLDSAINQTLKDIEIICVNDGSTDSSPEILRNYAKSDSRMIVLQQKNAGAGAARNNGLFHATGDFIYFLDGDDFCDTSLLEVTVNRALETGADIVVFNHYRYDNASGKRDFRYGLNRNWLPSNSNTFCYKDMPDRIFSMINPTPWNKLYRSSFIKASKLQFLEISTTNDITFAAMSAAMATSITYIDKPLIHYRVNLSNSLTSFKRDKLENVIVAVLNLNEQAAKLPYYQEIINGVRRFVISNLLFALNNYAGEPSGYPYIEYYKKLKAIFNDNALFTNMRLEDLQNKKLWEEFCLIKSSEVVAQALNKKPRIIVSLTSYPDRIGTVHQAIETLLKQTLKPDMVILWLAEEQFPGKEQELPKKLIKQIERGLTIKWCKDLKSYKKLIPTLKLYPDDIIVTVDDDLLFAPYMIERLYKGYQQHPDCIQCHRVTKITYSPKEIKIAPSGRVTYPCATYLHKLCGGAGCLYPPSCLYQDVTNENFFTKLAPTSDDIWFWLMGVLKGYKVNVVENNIPNLNYIPGTQEGPCLWKVNDRGDKLFFMHLNNILEHYPELKSILANEQKKLDEQTDNTVDMIIIKKTKSSQNVSSQAESQVASKLDPKFNKEFATDNLKIQAAFIRAERAEREIKLIRSSLSYKIGCFITYIPRKIRGGFRCCQEHGFKYTLKRFIYKIVKLISSLKNRLLKHYQKNMQTTNNLEASNKAVQVLKAKSEPKKNSINITLSMTKKGYIPQKAIKNYDYYKNLAPSAYEEELKEWFLKCTKNELNLDKPQTFNEKIQWLKLYDSTPLKTKLADKYLVREWVKEKIGKQYLIPLLGVWNCFDEINFSQLPDKFVIKTNHGSGWNKIVTDKSSIDFAQLKKQFDTWMNTNFAYKASLELHYMKITPKIIVEKYIENDGDLYDYKFLCFNSQPRFVWIDVGRYTDHRRNIYNLDWELQPFTIAYKQTDGPIAPPKKLKEMAALAEKLCQGFSHVRVDFYEIDDQIYFGEMTFTSGNGGEKFTPEEYGKILGDMIALPPKKEFIP